MSAPKKLTKEEIAEVLEKHLIWIRSREGGVRANLFGANLVGATLNGADLYGAKLDGAKRFGSEITSSPIMVSNIGSQGGTLEVWPTRKGLMVKRGCFTGSKREFLDAVESKHSAGRHGAAYRLTIKMIEESFAARKVVLTSEDEGKETK